MLLSGRHKLVSRFEVILGARQLLSEIYCWIFKEGSGLNGLVKEGCYVGLVRAFQNLKEAVALEPILKYHLKCTLMHPTKLLGCVLV